MILALFLFEKLVKDIPNLYRTHQIGDLVVSSPTSTRKSAVKPSIMSETDQESESLPTDHLSPRLEGLDIGIRNS